jgi:hypothetical protein
MIHETAHQLEDRGFSIAMPIEDQDGTIGYGLYRDGEKSVLAVKEYAYRGLGSFMLRLVQQAAGSQMRLIFYENQDETFTVFDSEYYAKHGAVSDGKSKTRDTRWLELPLSDGVALDDYIRNGQSPMTLAGENETLGAF